MPYREAPQSKGLVLHTTTLREQLGDLTFAAIFGVGGVAGIVLGLSMHSSAGATLVACSALAFAFSLLPWKPIARSLRSKLHLTVVGHELNAEVRHRNEVLYRKSIPLADVKSIEITARETPDGTTYALYLLARGETIDLDMERLSSRSAQETRRRAVAEFLGLDEKAGS